MTEKHEIDDLPDEVFVSLGRRGMEGIPLKECAYDCDGKELVLLDVRKEPPEIARKGQEEVVEDWKVQCKKCHRKFTIRCKIRYFDGKRFDTMVNILDDIGNDLGWLGSF